MTITGIGFALAAVAVSAAPSEGPLDAPSLCEASAAVVAPWSPELVLVADNEIDDRLFSFVVTGRRLVFSGIVPLPGGSRPRDVEALAAIDGKIAVVGSHSDSKRGEVRPKRSRVALYAPPSGDGGLRLVRAFDNADAIAAARRGVPECLRLLFASPAPSRAPELCTAWGGEAPQFEGAIALPGAGRSGSRLWLGLRAPLLEGRALLLRLVEGAGEFRFDAIVAVELGGLGIRELAAIDGRIFAIGGPAGDRAGDFHLFELPPAVGEGAAWLPARRQAELPNGSEALVPAVAGVIALVDVNRPGGGDSACPGSARQVFVPLMPAEAEDGGATRQE